MSTADYRARRNILREVYRIPDAWNDLGLEGTPSTSCRCPWREDRKPSFSVYNQGRSFKDFSTDDTGDIFNFVMIALEISFKDAAQWIEERNGMTRRAFAIPAQRLNTFLKKPKPKPVRKPKFPPLDTGNPRDREQLALNRGICPYALHIAIQIGTLRFGNVCGHPSWILMDDGRMIAEARRLDGKPYNALGSLPARKAHTLSGSSKSWPLGLTLDHGKATPGATILLVEGGPDYLAAFDFMLKAKKPGFQPVAILGKSNRLASEALKIMTGRTVRIYPHRDPNGGGMEAAEGWFRQLNEIGCKVDGFSFEDLTKIDGQPVTDLNDLLLADEESKKVWKGILP